MMRTQRASQTQLKLYWAEDHRRWNQIPLTQRNLSQELLARLLRVVAEAESNERSESDEREHPSHAS